MKGSGGDIVLSGIHRQPLEMLRKAGFIDVIGRKNFCAHFDDSLRRARELLAEQEKAKSTG
jgi:SulP family sulfate permease